MRISMSERFFRKVDVLNWKDCWIWTGAKNKSGYGSFKILNKAKYSHRVSYELLVGIIPEGLQLDHLCRNRACVNPHHLEPVTQKENVLRGESVTAKNARKTVCPRGHSYDEDNTAHYKKGSRICKKCANIRNLAYQRRLASERRNRK